MKKKNVRRDQAPSFVEPLEHRTLLSADAGAAMHADVKAPTTHTTIHVQRHVLKLGQSDLFTGIVTAPKKLGPISGTIEFLNNGNPIQGTSGDLAITLGAHNRASYTFAAGNVALFVGREAFSAEFISSDPTTVPNSTSKSTIVNVTVPRLKTATDGLETATVHPGHGKAIKAGQTATVVYTGFLASTGEIFDYATANHGTDTSTTYTFPVEASPEQVISGFDQGTVGMHVGETRVLAIPSALGYGTQASGSIPANSDLVFLITLEGISA